MAEIFPYVIEDSYDTEERSTIAKAMKMYHNKTCIRFLPRTSEEDYIHIKGAKDEGCFSAVGRFGRNVGRFIVKTPT